MNQDLDHLKTLSFFHFAIAGLAVLCTCCFTSAFLARILELIKKPSEVPSELLITVIVTAVYFLPGWIYAAFLIILGIFLMKPKHHTLCIIMAVISCVFIPFGTILGMFTIGVLSRPTVKELFNSRVPIAHV